MKNKIEILKKQFVVSSITCDVCGKVFDLNTTDGILETQEFLFIDFVGGYSSVFGDFNHIECDICQHCLKKFLDSGINYRCSENFIF